VAGTWTGAVVTYESEVPFEITFRPDGDAHAALGGQLSSLLNAITWTGPTMSTRLHGTMPTGDFRPYRHELTLTLRLEGDRLAGQLTARTHEPTRLASSYVRLVRRPRDQP
jgi:hypothetical protein